jgi:hypothetical protein
VLTLGACSQEPQSGGAKKVDAKAAEGTINNQYTASGWTKGDKTSWESQLNTRTKQGQNEYTRVIPVAASAPQ